MGGHSQHGQSDGVHRCTREDTGVCGGVVCVGGCVVCGVRGLCVCGVFVLCVCLCVRCVCVCM